MVESAEEDGDFGFDDADEEKVQLEEEQRIAGVKGRQSYFVGKGGAGGTLSVMKREKNLNGEASEECFQRGETTAADAIAQASEDESLKKYIASLGIDNLCNSASSSAKGNAEETFVEFVKLEIVSEEHPDGCMPVDFLKPDKEGVIQTVPCKVKEGCVVGFRVTMKVYNDTVRGLDFRGDLKYKDMKSV